MKIDGQLQHAAAIGAGDTATVELEPLSEWPEPDVPQDLERARAAAHQTIQDLWRENTPRAMWSFYTATSPIGGIRLASRPRPEPSLRLLLMPPRRKSEACTSGIRRPTWPRSARSILGRRIVG